MSINPISINSSKDQHLLDLKYGNDYNYLFEPKTNEIKTSEKNSELETVIGDTFIISKDTIVVIILVSILVFFLLASIIDILFNK